MRPQRVHPPRTTEAEGTSRQQAKMSPANTRVSRCRRREADGPGGSVRKRSPEQLLDAARI